MPSRRSSACRSPIGSRSIRARSTRWSTSQATYEAEKALFGRAMPARGNNPKPTRADLKAPPDGMAEHAQPADQHAIDFIIEQVEKYPHEVTLLVIGPVTNIALAVRKDPDIVPLIKRIVYMGGAVDVPGNVTPAAEFNWWFDPEAAKIVLREPIPQAIIPLDVTNTVTVRQAAVRPDRQ